MASNLKTIRSCGSTLKRVELDQFYGGHEKGNCMQISVVDMSGENKGYQVLCAELTRDQVKTAMQTMLDWLLKEE